MPLFNELTNKIQNLLFQIEKAIEIEEQINDACHVALTKRPYYSVWKLLCDAKEQLKAWAKQPNIEQITAMHEKLKDIENDIRVQKNPLLWLNASKYKKTNNSELLAKIDNIKNMPNISKEEIRSIIVNLITNIENKIAVENMFYDYSGGDVPDTPPHMWTAILVHKLKEKFAQNENEWNIKQLWTLKIELATIMEEINTIDKWCWSSAKKYEKADNPELLAKMEKMITNNINESNKYYKPEQGLSDFIARKIQAMKEKIETIDEAIKIETMIFEAHEIVGTAITTNDFTDLQNALTAIKERLAAENNLKIKDLLKLDIELDKMQLKINATDPATMWSNARKYEKADNPKLLKKITIIETSSNTEKKIINEIKTLIVAIDNKITVERMVYLVNTKQNDIPSYTPYFSFQNSLEIFTQQLQKETLNLEQLVKIKNKLEAMNLEINVTGPVAMWNNARKYKTATNSELLAKIAKIKGNRNIIAAANTLEETLQAGAKNKEKCCVL